MTSRKQGLSRLWAKAGIHDLAAWGGTVLIGLFAALVPYFFNRRFYFYNDEENFYYPYYLDIGRQLRHGHWPLLTLSTFSGGNLSINWQFALFNPVSLLSCWLIAPARNLELTGLCFSGFYIIFLALGGYFLARSFGLGRHLSVVVAAVLATNNYIIFFYAGAWLQGLVSWSWFIWTWTALQSYRAGGRADQLLAFVVCAYLTVTCGWPNAMIMLALLIAAYLVEIILEETICWPKVVSLVLSGLALALLTTPSLLPALLSFGWTDRASGFFNHQFLAPNLGDLLNSSAFFHLPHMKTYNGPAPIMPLLHLAWFVFPLAPLLDWKCVVQALTRRWALGIFGVAGLLLLYGPEQLGPFRYPIRFLPFVHAVLLIGFFLAVARPDSLVFSKWRMTLSLAVIFLGFTSGISDRPELFVLHLLGASLSVILTLVAIYLVQNNATRFLPLWLLCGVLLGYLVTHACYTSNLELASPRSNPMVTAPADASEKSFDGYSLYAGSNPAAIWRGWSHEFFYSAQAIYQGVPSINGYTPLAPRAFSSRISDNNWTSIENPQAVAYLFSTNAETGMRIIDLMRVNTLLLEKNSTALWVRPFLDDQWKEVSEGSYAIRFEKTNPNHDPTTLAWSSPGIQTQPVGAPTGEFERLTVEAGADGGSLVFARLWWPGYSASLDGQPLEAAPLDGLFVKVSLPAHARGVLTLTFVPPGLHFGFFLAGLGVLLLGFTLFRTASRHRKFSDGA